MQFNLYAILSAVAFFTTTVLAMATGEATNATTEFRGCFKGGEKWTDLGTTDQIYAALDSNACNPDTGAYKVGEILDMCILVEKSSNFNDDNSFHFSWTITKVPDGQDTGYVSHGVCVGFASQIINNCPRGGIFDLISGPGNDGGDVVGAAVTADPQQGPACDTEF